VQTPGI